MSFKKDIQEIYEGVFFLNQKLSEICRNHAAGPATYEWTLSADEIAAFEFIEAAKISLDDAEENLLAVLGE